MPNKAAAKPNPSGYGFPWMPMETYEAPAIQRVAAARRGARPPYKCAKAWHRRIRDCPRTLLWSDA